MQINNLFNVPGSAGLQFLACFNGIHGPNTRRDTIEVGFSFLSLLSCICFVCTLFAYIFFFWHSVLLFSDLFFAAFSYWTCWLWQSVFIRLLKTARDGLILDFSLVRFQPLIHGICGNDIVPSSLTGNDICYIDSSSLTGHRMSPSLVVFMAI